MKAKALVTISTTTRDYAPGEIYAGADAADLIARGFAEPVEDEVAPPADEPKDDAEPPKGTAKKEKK